MKILHLTLRKEPYDIMSTGEKVFEYRKPSKWILSRLNNKDGSKKNYDYVKFTNGYGNDKPHFFVEYKGYDIVEEAISITYSNGLCVEIPKGTIKISLGSIIETHDNFLIRYKICEQ